MYIFVLFAFWIPLRRAFHPWTTRQSGALWGLKWVRRRERERRGDTGKSKREKEGRQRGRGGGWGSFERLLTSKLTVIAVLARGESTFKHTGWVTMYRDYKSKATHNKQCSLCSARLCPALPANLHQIGDGREKEKKNGKCSKGQQRPRVKASCALTLHTRCSKIQKAWTSLLDGDVRPRHMDFHRDEQQKATMWGSKSKRDKMFYILYVSSFTFRQ